MSSIPNRVSPSGPLAAGDGGAGMYQVWPAEGDDWWSRPGSEAKEPLPGLEEIPITLRAGEPYAVQVDTMFQGPSAGIQIQIRHGGEWSDAWPTDRSVPATGWLAESSGGETATVRAIGEVHYAHVVVAPADADAIRVVASGNTAMQFYLPGTSLKLAQVSA